MSSILTNNGAMVALQTLQSINKNLGATQGEISTGKSVATAKDNSAVWAISKQMESDVQGFKSIQESLALGESTVAVARNASETITDLLTEIKGKIVASQEENVDRSKIQTDISAMRDQIDAVVGAAQFNGLNLLSNTDADAGSGNVSILSSLDRSGSGVKASQINVGKQDLGQGASVAGTTAGTATTVSAATAAADGGTATYDFAASDAGYGTSYEFSATIGGETIEAQYVQRDGESASDAVSQMASRLNSALAEAGIENVSYAADPQDSSKLMVTNDSDTAVATVAGDITVTTDGTAGGGLEALAGLDVTSETGSNSALAAIEGLIQTAIDSAASFGSSQGRIETQSDFISKLSDSLTSGIGSLVDANMEEASARLQALQVQQQLATQSLSIANQAPQSILSLFR